MYIYCVYPAISKSPKQLPNCLKITETCLVLIVFNVVIHFYCYHFFLSSTRIRYKNALLGPWLNNTEVFFTLKTTQCQDKLYFFFLQIALISIVTYIINNNKWYQFVNCLGRWILVMRWVTFVTGIFQTFMVQRCYNLLCKASLNKVNYDCMKKAIPKNLSRFYVFVDNFNHYLSTIR
jgi:hypothetical protein